MISGFVACAKATTTEFHSQPPLNAHQLMHSTSMDSDEEEDKSSSSDEGSCHNSSSNNLKLLSTQGGGSGGSLSSQHSTSIFSSNSSHTSSMGVFLEFLRIIPEENGEIDPVNGKVDASEIVSKACFDRWLAARKIPPTKPEKSFQRTLSAHLTGLDGRSPFEPKQEAAILEVLRKPQRWPCFENESVKFGLRGFRAKGYHEKKRAEAAAMAGGELNTKTVMGTSTAPPLQPQPPMLTMNFAPPQPQQQHVPQLSGLFPPVHQPQHQQPFPLDSPRFSMFPTFAQQQQHYVDPMRFVLPKHLQQPPTPNGVPPQLFPRVVTQTPFSPTSAAAAAAMLESQKRLRGSGGGTHYPEVFSSTVIAPPPQLPQNSDLEIRFLEAANEILLNASLGRTSSTGSLLDGGSSSPSNNNNAAWREVINLAKMNLLAKGWGSTTMPLQANADMVIAAYERTNSCALVLVIDVLEPEPRLRVMAQSQCARMFLGPITRNESGLSDTLLGDDQDNAWKLLTTMVEAFRFPDHESKGVQVKLRGKNLQGVFTIYAKVFSVEHLVALRAVPCT